MDGLVRLRGSEVLWNELDGEVVVLDLRSSTYLALNPVGSTLWRRLEGPASVGDLVEVVLAEYEVGREQAEADVVSFLAELRGRGLLEDSSAQETT